MINKKISIIIFFLSVTLFCLNLQYNYSAELKQTIFWMAITFMLGTLLYQIFYLKNNQFVLFEIIIFYFLLHLVYQIGYFGLRDSDTYRDFDFLKTILNNHSFKIDWHDVDIDVSGWPLIHLLASFSIMITKIEPFLIVKILPSFIASIIAIPIYLFISNLYKNKKAALVGCLLFGTIPEFVSFEALFVRECFALYFFILLLYVLYIAKQRDDYQFLTLSIILIPIIVLAHHFTAFMFIIFLLIFIFSSVIIPYLFRRKIILYIFRDKANLNFNNIYFLSFFIILILVALLYWFYFVPNIVNSFFKIYYDTTGQREFVTYGQRIGLGQTIITLRGNIQYYGFFFFQGISALILLTAILLKKLTHIIEDFSFTVYLIFCLFLGSLSLYVLGSLIFPDRFLSFGWILGVIPLGILLFNLKNIHLKKLILVIIVSFIIFNIYNINPNYYTGKAALGGGVATEKEYAIAETINISTDPKIIYISKIINITTRPYYGYNSVSNAIYDIQGIESRFGGAMDPIQTNDFFNDSNFAIINKGIYQQYLESIKIKSPIAYNKIITVISYENFYNINKICDLDDVFILTWKK
jgi:hypothetical protein